LDFTPCLRSSRRRLFLPDDTATYDSNDEGFRRDNIRIALSDDPDIEDLFKASKRRSAFYNQLPGVRISNSESRELEKIDRRLAQTTAVLARKYRN
jgi:hypothetical protein